MLSGQVSIRSETESLDDYDWMSAALVTILSSRQHLVIGGSSHCYISQLILTRSMSRSPVKILSLFEMD